jgi:hypothetical protein
MLMAPKPEEKDHKRRRKKTRTTTTGGKHSQAIIEEPRVETLKVGDNECTGVLHRSSRGGRYLEGDAVKYAWANGVRFEGSFVAGQIDGKGRFVWPDGSFYDGDLLNGLRHGEGTYTLPDKVTRYTGQWSMGKRHGVGRLSYDQNGESHYHGQWENDMKHGHGRQIWPSRNVYEGQWECGAMSGQGEMKWIDDEGLMEVYRGCWENNSPSGTGTHTWHAAGAPAGRALPSQQMNNRYVGSWKKGARSGNGVFYYANGARYEGSWNESQKDGEGCYTYEDGRTYRGQFVSDTMSGADVGPSATVDPSAGIKAAPLNMGGPDNPLRQMIDISDLDLDADACAKRAACMLSADSADQEDAMSPASREVHNMLLRNLGELKALYQQCRLVSPWHDADPFVVTQHQLWILARDVELLTPSCTLSRLDRLILNGPRHHQEAGRGDEMADLRPLTPRLHPDKMTHTDTGAAAARKSRWVVPDMNTVDLEEYDGSDTEMASGEITPSDATVDDAKSHVEHVEGGFEPERHMEEDAEDEVQHKWKKSLLSCPSDSNLRSSFWRREGEDGLSDIHAASCPFTFRHFLEGVVRMAIAGYPNEDGLDQRVRRLFKERLIPAIGKPANVSSKGALGFLSDERMERIRKHNEALLWKLFKSLVPNHDRAEHHGRSSFSQDCSKENLDPLEADSKAHQISIGRWNIHPRTRRRGVGGLDARMHVKARLDVTVRVKDLLQLLNVSGMLLLSTGKPAANPLSFGEAADTCRSRSSNPESDPFGAVFPGPIAPNLPSDPQGGGDERATPVEGLEALAGTNMTQISASTEIDPAAVRLATPQMPPTPAAAQLTTMTLAPALATSCAASANPPNTCPLVRPANRSSLTDEDGIPYSSDTAPPKENASASASSADASEFQVDNRQPVEDACAVELCQKCDFTRSTVEVLGFIAEMMRSSSLTKLRWSVRGDDSTEGLVPLLEYVESEVTFIEFQRLLMRLADCPSTRSEEAMAASTEWQQLPAFQRLDMFLRTIFEPSLCKPYKPPQPKPSVPDPVTIDPEPSPDANELPRDSSDSQKPKAEAKRRPSRTETKDKKEERRPSQTRTEKRRPSDVKGAASPKKNANAVAADERPAEPAPVLPPPPPTFWFGFDMQEGAGATEDAEEGVCTRVWPTSYHTEIGDW